MGQVTIYLDAETERLLNRMVKESGLPKSRWVTELIRQRITDVWPEAVRRLAGAWKDFPSAEELRRDLEPDAAREDL